MAIIVNRKTLRPRRIFHYTPVKTYIANLSDHDIFVPYIGMWGFRLPALSEKTKPVLRQIRLFKDYRTRVKMINRMMSDSDPETGRIAIGSKAEVEAAIKAKREANAAAKTDDGNN